MANDYEIFELGSVQLQSGATLRDCKLAYKTYGSLNSKKNNVIVYSDLYFPPEDSKYEASKMPNAEFRPIPSIWGHFAGGPGTNPVDVKFLDKCLKELLAS